MPYTLGALVGAFEDPARGRSPWPYLFAYVGLRFLQGSGGLSALRDVRVIHAIPRLNVTNVACVGYLGSCYAILRPRYVHRCQPEFVELTWYRNVATFI